MTKLRVATVAGVVGATVTAVVLAASLSGGRPGPDRVHVLSPAGATGSTSTVAPTTTTVPVTTTAPATTVAHATVTPVATAAAPTPSTQPQMRVTSVTYTVGGSCSKSASYTVTCDIRVTASDGSTPTGDAILTINGTGADQESLTNGSTVLTGHYSPADTISSVDVGYRGGPNRSADTVFPLS